MRIAILGAGHMGGWLAGTLSGRHDVGVFDIRAERADRLPNVKVLHENSELSSFAPEMLINAVSLENTIQAFESAESHLSADCIVSDVASVKGPIADYYRKCPFRFASTHPMFGPTFANVDDLSEENVILIQESDPEGAKFFHELFSGLNLNIFSYSFEQHDRMIAYSLTLPFASTMVFAACMDNTAVPGTTFRKHLQIAHGLLSEDDYLLSEILFNPHSLTQLEQVTHRLDFLKHVIQQRDFEEAQKFFNRLRQNIR
jgi:prephenate dehydrogenase